MCVHQTPQRLFVAHLEPAMLDPTRRAHLSSALEANSSRRPSGITRCHCHRRNDPVLASSQRRSTLRALSHGRREPMALPANRSQRPARRDRNLHHGHLHAPALTVRAFALHAFASTKQKGPPLKKAALSFSTTIHGVRQLCCRFSRHAASTKTNPPFRTVSCRL